MSKFSEKVKQNLPSIAVLLFGGIMIMFFSGYTKEYDDSWRDALLALVALLTFGLFFIMVWKFRR